MSSTHPIVTIELVLNRHTTKEVLRAVLHSILFHRLFGIVKPQTFEVLDVTMPGVDDPEIQSLIDEKVNIFWKGMEDRAEKRGEITVTFSEKRPRKSWFLIAGIGGEEEIPWEQWNIKAEIRQPTTEEERHNFDAALASTLTKSLQTMLMHTSSERGRSVVPLITDQSLSPFPIKIAVRVGGTEIG